MIHTLVIKIDNESTSVQGKYSGFVLGLELRNQDTVENLGEKMDNLDLASIEPFECEIKTCEESWELEIVDKEKLSEDQLVALYIAFIDIISGVHS